MPEQLLSEWHYAKRISEWAEISNGYWDGKNRASGVTDSFGALEYD